MLLCYFLSPLYVSYKIYKTTGLTEDVTRMDLDTTLNVLIYDEMSAHYAFLKECYNGAEHNVQFFSLFKLENLTSFIADNSIKVAIVFSYEKKGIVKLLPFIEQQIPIIICAHEKEIWWLEEILTQVKLVDMGLPKQELFSKINTYLFKH